MSLATTNFDKAVLTVATAAFLALGGWSLMSISDAKSRLAVEESKSTHFENALDRIDDKLERILERISSDRRESNGATAAAPRRRPVPDTRSAIGGP